MQADSLPSNSLLLGPLTVTTSSAPSHRNVSEWLDYVHHQAIRYARSTSDENPYSREVLSIEAPTDLAAAKALVACLIGHFSGCNPIIDSGTTIGIFCFQHLLTGIRTWRVGQATGDGVERSVLRAALKYITSNGRYWKQLDDLGHFTLCLSPGGVSNDRLIQLKAYGCLAALHIYWAKSSPFPISPWLMTVITLGESIVKNLNFVSDIDPELALKLKQWPIDPNTPIDT
ncbi:hypothetical protein C0992_007229, partial [Termitomyces sp. T32_za158]